MSKAKDSFDFEDYTYREFQAFLIILSHEGEKLKRLKDELKKRFGLESRTKGYDYINTLCKKGLVYKKSIQENGKNQTKIFVKKEARESYEKFIILTISDVKLALKELFKDKLKEIERIDIVREKFKNYTESLIEEIKGLIKKTSESDIKKKKFLKTIENRILANLNSEMLQYEIWSK